MALFIGDIKLIPQWETRANSRRNPHRRREPIDTDLSCPVSCPKQVLFFDAARRKALAVIRRPTDTNFAEYCRFTGPSAGLCGSAPGEP